MKLISFAGAGPGIMNLIMVVWLVVGFLIGLFTGFLERTIKVIEMFIIVFLSILLKNPISALLYKYLPFINFKIKVLNILMYEIIAFIVVTILLIIIIKLINKAINLVESIFAFILNIGFPKRILGGVITFFEGAFYLYIFVFIVFFISTIMNMPIEDSLANKYFDRAPVLSQTLGPIFKSSVDIASYTNTIKDKDTLECKSLDILLSYKIISKENAKYLVDKNKLNFKGVENVIDKY